MAAQDKKLKIVHVDQGDRGGGLEAAAFIPRDEVICGYSGDRIIIDDKKPWTDADAKRHAAAYSHSYVEYPLVIYGDRSDRLSGCYVNDVSRPELVLRLAECRSLLAVAVWWRQYLREAVAASEQLNVSYRQERRSKNGPIDKVNIVATRDIKQGEPLLTVYGPAYWLERAMLQVGTAPMTKAALVVFYMTEMRAQNAMIRKSLPVALASAGVRNVLLPCSPKPLGPDDWIWVEEEGGEGRRTSSVAAMRHIWPGVETITDWQALVLEVGATDGLGVADFAASTGLLQGDALPVAVSCAVCGRSGTPRRCGHCTASLYCSRACQKADWPAHRARCVDLTRYVRSFAAQP
jgi:hypothetical protein